MFTLQKQLLTHLLHSNNNKNTNIQLIQVCRELFWFGQPGKHCWKLQAHSLINSEKLKETPWPHL